jgi:hypothetical protein
VTCWIGIRYLNILGWPSLGRRVDPAGFGRRAFAFSSIARDYSPLS